MGVEFKFETRRLELGSGKRPTPGFISNDINDFDILYVVYCMFDQTDKQTPLLLDYILEYLECSYPDYVIYYCPCWKEDRRQTTDWYLRAV